MLDIEPTMRRHMLAYNNHMQKQCNWAIVHNKAGFTIWCWRSECHGHCERQGKKYFFHQSNCIPDINFSTIWLVGCWPTLAMLSASPWRLRRYAGTSVILWTRLNNMFRLTHSMPWIVHSCVCTCAQYASSTTCTVWLVHATQKDHSEHNQCTAACAVYIACHTSVS